MFIQISPLLKIFRLSGKRSISLQSTATVAVGRQPTEGGAGLGTVAPAVAAANEPADPGRRRGRDRVPSQPVLRPVHGHDDGPCPTASRVACRSRGSGEDRGRSTTTPGRCEPEERIGPTPGWSGPRPGPADARRCASDAGNLLAVTRPRSSRDIRYPCVTPLGSVRDGKTIRRR